MFLRPFFPGLRTVTRAPVIGSLSTLTDSQTTDWGAGTTRIASHRSNTGNILTLACAKSAGSPSGFLAAAWNGHAMTQVDAANRNGSGRGIVYGGIIRGSDTGLFDMVFDGTLGNMRLALGWVMDLDILAASPFGSHAASVINVVQSGHEVSLTPTDPGSLLVAAVFALDGRTYPLADDTPSAGWTTLRQWRTDNAANDISGTLAYRIAGATTAQRFGAAAAPPALTTDDFTSIMVELVAA